MTEPYPHALFMTRDPTPEQLDQMRGYAARTGQYCRYCDSMLTDPCLTASQARGCADEGHGRNSLGFGDPASEAEPLFETGIREAHRECSAGVHRIVRAGQRRRHSLLESIGNTLAGFLVSYVAWIPVNKYVLHRQWHPGEGFVVVLIFTVISIARNYVVRRAFNRWT